MKKGILTSLILKWNNISRLICLLLTVVIFSTGINVPAFANNPASQTDLEAVETQEVTDEDTDNPGDTGDDSGDTKKDLNDLNPEADPAPETTNQDPADSEKDLKEPEKEKTEENAQPESNPESELHSENIEPGSVKGPQKSTEPNPEEIADDKEQEKVPVDCTAVINDVINGTLQDASKPYRIRLTVKNTAPILLRANAEFAFTLRVTDEDSGHAFTYEGKEINPETGFYEIEDTRYFKGECDHLLEIESVDGKSTGSFQISILKPQKEDSDETNEQNDDEEDDDEEDDDEDDINQKDDEGTESEENQEDSEQNDDLKSETSDPKETKQDNGLKSLSLFRKGLEQTEVSGEQKDGNTLSDAPQTREGTYTVSIPESNYYTLTCLKLNGDIQTPISNGDNVSPGDVLNVEVFLNKEGYTENDGYLLESIKVDYSDPAGTETFTDFSGSIGSYTRNSITIPGSLSNHSTVTISCVIKVRKTYTIEVEWGNESNGISHDDNLPTGIGVQTRKSSTNDSWTNLDVSAEREDLSTYSEWTYTHTYYPDDPYEVRFVEIDSSGSRIDPDSQTIALFNVNVETDDEDPTPSRAFYEVSYTTPYGNDSLKTLITNTLCTSERTLKVNFTDEGNVEERPEKIKAVLQYKKSNGQWITIKQQDVSISTNWKATFSGVPKLASTSSNDPIRIRLVNDAGGLVYDHIGTPDADDPNPDDNDREAFFNSVQGDDNFPVEECSVTYHDVDYVRTRSGARIPSYYPGRMRASGNALRDGGGGGAGNEEEEEEEEEINLGGQQVELGFRVEIDWGNNIIGLPAPVTVQLQKQDQPDGNWSVIQSHALRNDDDWRFRFEIVVDQIANDYRVRELDRNGNALEQDASGYFDINDIGGVTQVSYLASYKEIPNPNNGGKRIFIVNTKSNKNCSARIVWDGNGQQFESMDSVEVVLQKKENNNLWSDAATITLSKDNNWQAEFNNVQMQDGTQYRVREKDKGNNIIENNGDAVMKVTQDGQQKDVVFTVGYATDANSMTTITNTRKEAKKYTAKIVWDDGDQQFEGKDPIDVVLQKQINGQWADVETKTLPSNNVWQIQFDTLILYDEQYRIREKENTGDRKVVEFDGSPANMCVTQNNEKKTVNYNVKYTAQEDGMTTITNIFGAPGQRKHYVALIWEQTPEAIIPESVKVVLQRKNKEDGDWETIQTKLLKKSENWEGFFEYQQEAEDEKLRVRELNADDVVVLDADRDDDLDGYNDVPMWYRITDANNNQCRIYMKYIVANDYKDPEYSQYEHITNITNFIPTERYTVTVDWDDESRQAGLEGSVKVREQVKESEEEAWEDLKTADFDEVFSKANNWTHTYEHDYSYVEYEEINNDEIPVTKRMKYRYRVVDSDGNTVDENGTTTANDAGNITWKVTYENNAYNYIIHMSRKGLSYSAKKIWQNNNIPGYIPDSVTARLQGCKNPNGDGAWETIQDITLNRDNNWEAKFKETLNNNSVIQNPFLE